MWGDPATAGTGRFFQTLGQAPAADVPQSAATGTKGCSLAGFEDAALINWICGFCAIYAIWRMCPNALTPKIDCGIRAYIAPWVQVRSNTPDETMHLPLTFQKKPIEFVSAFAMILAGVYFSSTGVAGSATVVIGSLLSALGGALLSWSTVSLSSKEAAAEVLRPQLAAIARQLVTVSGQISKAVQDARSGELEEPVALEMISQAARIMYASVNEIHVVLNQKVDFQELLDTAQRVEELATKLAGGVPSSQDEAELMSAVAELKNQVQAIAPPSATSLAGKSGKLIPKAAPHELENIQAPCPACAVQTSVAIGPAPGSSAMPICASCGARFHAHRSPDGGVVTKLPGANREQLQARLQHSDFQKLGI